MKSMGNQSNPILTLSRLGKACRSQFRRYQHLILLYILSNGQPQTCFCILAHGEQSWNCEVRSINNVSDACKCSGRSSSKRTQSSPQLHKVSSSQASKSAASCKQLYKQNASNLVKKCNPRIWISILLSCA